MLVLKDDTRMYFKSDKEFYDFCVVPKLITKKYINAQGEEDYYCDFELSDAYNKAVEKGIHFFITDENSQICKHQAVSYRTITKPIQNLFEFFKIV